MAIGLKKGTLLHHGMYRVERILGSGGFGITYLATDLGLDKLRAIKEFFPKDYCDRNETTSLVTLGTANTSEFVDKLKKKFIKEARNIANLDQHPGIITIHAVFEENNTAYYVMDYIEGENLSEIIKRDGPLPVDKAIKYITEVGNALEYVHSHHINHLDIKPANIMIRRKDDSPILIDFGLSKQYDSEGLQTSTTPTGISHGYAPFEQYKDGGVKEFSPQTDVYSLAATLYYLVSGKVPPHATDLIENELSFPEGFPYLLKEPISIAMSLRRQGRHENVKDFVNSLKQEDEITVISTTHKTTFQQELLKKEQLKEDNNKGINDNKISSLTQENIKNQETETLIRTHEDIVKDGNPNYNIVLTKKKKKTKNLSLKCFLSKYKHLTKKKRRKFYPYFIGIIILIVISLLIINYYIPSSSPQFIPYSEIKVTGYFPKRVENMRFTNPYGRGIYTGEVNSNNLPNGQGEATWETGKIKQYIGDWENGEMNGNGRILMRNGEIYKGEFTNNEPNKKIKE